MPLLHRVYCSRCANSTFNTFVGADGERARETDPDAVRVPLAIYFVVGQPADTGVVDWNGEGVRIPSFMREMMQPHIPVARIELCVVCVHEVFGVALVTAEEDPMYSVEQAELSGEVTKKAIENHAMHSVDKSLAIMDRVLKSILVGRGAEKAPALPPVKVKPEINESKTIDSEETK